MDKTNKDILRLLQEDATLPVSEIAQRVGLSTTPCWRRIQQLEQSGVIARRVTLLNPTKINVGVTVFMSVKAHEHSEAWFRAFASVVASIPQIVEFYRMSGETDYLMRVVVPDIAAFDGVYKRIVRDVKLSDISSSFAMEQIKFTTALPLDYA
ncbi:MAG: Lrp/AsnC family transcriptional regulator [Burkholderiaceae bacterium]